MIEFIDLPDEENINLLHLLTLIADLKHPDISSATGIDSVFAKRVFTATFPDGMPVKISTAERAQLVPILDDLPSVQTEMSEEAIQEFLEAYRRHPARASWEPIIAGERNSLDNRYHRSEVMSVHLKELDDLIVSGKLQAFDRLGMLVNRYGPDVYIKRFDASNYLARRGLINEAPASSASVSSPKDKKRRPESYSDIEKQAMREHEFEHGRAAMMAIFGIRHWRDANAILGATKSGRKRSETIKRKDAAANAFGAAANTLESDKSKAG